MSRNFLLDNLNGDWLVHIQGENKWWTKGNYSIVSSKNIFDTDKSGWVVKDYDGLQIFGLETQGDPWQTDAKIVWNPHIISDTENIDDNVKIIAITDYQPIDLTCYYICTGKNTENNTWSGKKIKLQKNNDTYEWVVEEQEVQDLISQGYNVVINDIYNINATVRILLFSESTYIINTYTQNPADSNMILKDKQAFVNGEKIIGAIQTIDIFNIKPEIQNSQYSISIPPGYLQEGYIHSIDVVTPIIGINKEENKFTFSVTQGYVREYTHNIDIVTPNLTLVNNSLLFSIASGYVKEYDKKEITLDINVPNYQVVLNKDVLNITIATVETSNIKHGINEEGDKFIFSVTQGYVKEYTYSINVVTPIIGINNEENKFTFSVAQGYVKEYEKNITLDINASIYQMELNNDILNITIATIDISNIEPTINSQYSISIPPGYLQEGYIHSIDIVTPQININNEENKLVFSVASGYINEYTHNIDIVTPQIIETETGVTFNVSSGYLQEDYIYNINKNIVIPQININNEENKLTFSVAQGYLKENYTYSIDVVTPQININNEENVFTFSVAQGYVKEYEKNITLDINVPVQQVMLNQNQDILNITVKIYEGQDKFKPQKDATIIHTENKFIKNNITIEGDENLKSSNIKKGIVIFGVQGTLQGEIIEAENVEYGYVDENGLFQKIDLSGDTVEKVGEAVEMDKIVLFNLPQGVIGE